MHPDGGQNKIPAHARGLITGLLQDVILSLPRSRMHTAQREAAERDREIDTACRAAGIRVRGDSKPILDTLVETVEGQAVAALRIPKRMYVFGTCLRSKFQVMQRTRCALSHTVLHGAGRSHSADPSLIRVEKVSSYGVGTREWE